jgi:hypothetical protein
MPLKYTTRLILTALFIAWCFDQLFWKKAPGISFFVFVVLCLLGGALLTWWEKRRPVPASLVLLAPVLFFATVTFVRQEPFTIFISLSITLTAMMVLALTWLGGKWLKYSMSDYLVGFLRLAGSALARPVGVLFRKGTGNGSTGTNGNTSIATEPARSTEVDQSAQAQPVQTAQPAIPARPRRVWAILRGLLLALPVVALLASLLAAADPIFSRQLDDLLKIFRIQNLGEYIFRVIYICIGAYLLIGVFAHALSASHEEKLIGVEKPWLTPFLGWTEAVIVLGSVDLLFAFFVAVQFRYFFGGQVNIHIDGYTYAEYARRGFGELVAVAVISLLLFLGLSAITRRQAGQQKHIFSGLGITLVMLVAAILVSAFQRLLLYEAAYSFTRLRAYTHVFMVWVGVLLAITVVLELLGRLRGFALALVVVVLGFGTSLAALNVDGFIARQNVARAVSGSEMDTVYLVGLSDDAVPALAKTFQDGRLSPALYDQVGGVLACRAASAAQDTRTRPWQAYHWSLRNANAWYAFLKPQLDAYPVTQGSDGLLHVKVNGVDALCEGYQIID